MTVCEMQQAQDKARADHEAAKKDFIKRRAAAVKAQLTAGGVPADRLLAVGYGATRPNSANPQAHARIEVVRAQ